MVHPWLANASGQLTVLTGVLAAFRQSLFVGQQQHMAVESVFDYVNPLIGTTGQDPREYGGMIPSTAPPFGMTRWTPMTRENWVSRLPYHYNDKNITGFMGTHQPAIWMVRVFSPKTLSY